MERGKIQMDERKQYYASVMQDINELKEYYPYVHLFLPPTSEIQQLKIHVTAVAHDIIEKTYATEDCYLGEFSKELIVYIPFNYQEEGCLVYGGKWINKDMIPEMHHHFNGLEDNGNYNLCVGTPKSFCRMKNVILECVKTADRLLVFYEACMTGNISQVNILEYSHGRKGIDEYEKEKKKYTTK